MCGIEVKAAVNGFQVVCWTVEDATHRITCQFDVTLSGEFVSGLVNCFALGWMKADELYFGLYMDEEYKAKKAWDEIKLL